jgi:pyridoxamine 5'-phosphate oxidase
MTNVPESALDERAFSPDPIVQFKIWYEESVATNAKWYDAMALATSTRQGRPSVRMVLLKHFDELGFVFYTNYNSRKGRDLAGNSAAALVFSWPILGRQVRIEGSVEKIPPADSDAYFRTRDRDSQISAHASSQSDPVASREELDSRFRELKRKFEGKDVPRPQHWGGFRLRPDRIEFWHEGYARLNDRIVYTRNEDGRWRIARLQP